VSSSLISRYYSFPENFYSIISDRVVESSLENFPGFPGRIAWIYLISVLASVVYLRERGKNGDKYIYLRGLLMNPAGTKQHPP